MHILKMNLRLIQMYSAVTMEIIIMEITDAEVMDVEATIVEITKKNSD